jgi:hypothetical protein
LFYTFRVEAHDHMAGNLELVIEPIEDPDEIVAGSKGELMPCTTGYTTSEDNEWRATASPTCWATSIGSLRSARVLPSLFLGHRRLTSIDLLLERSTQETLAEFMARDQLAPNVRIRIEIASHVGSQYHPEGFNTCGTSVVSSSARRCS